MRGVKFKRGGAGGGVKCHANPRPRQWRMTAGTARTAGEAVSFPRSRGRPARKITRRRVDDAHAMAAGQQAVHGLRREVPAERVEREPAPGDGQRIHGAELRENQRRAK